MNKVISMFNLERENKPHKKTILESWKNIYNNSRFTSGDETIQLEKNFADFCTTKYSLAVHSGTDALILSLRAAGISKSDEVITTPCTFSATADSIVHVGAKPVFVDVDPNTGNIDPSKIEEKITKKTKAILIVHLYGIPCEMDQIMKISKKNNVVVIEDASHAHGSLYKGKPVGSFGLAGCFSLYPSKTLGSMGNAGIITSNSKDFIKKARSYANHGISDIKKKYVHQLHGFNSLIDNLQSAVVMHKLVNLQKIIEKKLKIATQYNDAFNANGHKGMIWPDHVKPSLYVYAFQTEKRDYLEKNFKRNNIETGIYYPIPLHLQPSMSWLGYKEGSFKNAELFFKQTLSIPLYSKLNQSEIKKIVNTINENSN